MGTRLDCLLNKICIEICLFKDEDNEFEHFQDPEEFEGFQETTPRTMEQPKITISKVR